MVTTVAGEVNGFRPGLTDHSEGPKLQDVLGLIQDYEPYYRGFVGQCNESENYYFSRNEIAVPQGQTPVKMATARSIVDRATDHVDVDNVSLDVFPPSPRGMARSQKQKKFLIGFWNNIKRPVRRTAGKHGVMYGIGQLKTMWDA